MIISIRTLSSMLRFLIHLCTFIVSVRAPHYKGGTITWKPVDPTSNGTLLDVIIYQTHSWTLDRFKCNQSLIDNLGWYNDNGGLIINEPFIACMSGGIACSSAGFTATIKEQTYCTDFSRTLSISSGSMIKRMTLSNRTNIIVGFYGSAWADEIKTATNVAASNWRVLTRIDLTKTFPINSSPVTGSLPIIRVIEGQTAVIQIPAADWDLTNDLRCRWASSAGNAGDECGSICANLPNANLSSSECTITWLAVRRSVDSLKNSSTYVVAIMVEDFVSKTSTVPLSSVPLQMLIYTYQPAAGACNIVPNIIGDRPNRACIGVPINETLIERIVATVYCPNDYITEFVTISPIYMSKTTIAPVSGVSNQWFIRLVWTPKDEQKGPQVFCAAPVDQRGLTGPQHCVNFVVGYAAPNLIEPLFVQGSASPLGTVFSNHSIFSIQATGGVYRPNRNGTYVWIFNEANNTIPAWEADCGYSPDCVYIGSTVLFIVRNPNWIPGGRYYVLLSSGAASGNVFCAPESKPINDPNFWRFDIWNSARSSTTTTTTTPPTTATVTTRGPLTTTANANLTTTGIASTPSTTALIVTTSSTTIVSTTTSTSPVSQLTTTAGWELVDGKKYEDYCKQPVAIATAVFNLAMVPLHFISMFTLFIKIEKLFNPSRRAAQGREQYLIKQRLYQS